MVYIILIIIYSGEDTSLNRKNLLEDSGLALIFSTTSLFNKLGDSALLRFFVIVMRLALAMNLKSFKPWS